MTPLEIASVCHEANRRVQVILGEEPNPPWEEAPEEMRSSALNGVNTALNGATPEESHANWLRFKEDNGWTYGDVKDQEARTHPCMVPYDQLPQEQQVKDHLYLAIVETLKGLR